MCTNWAEEQAFDRCNFSSCVYSVDEGEYTVRTNFLQFSSQDSEPKALAFERHANRVVTGKST